MQAQGVRVLLANVFGHAVDVLHQLDRVLERVGVHALHQIGLDLRHAGAVVSYIIHLVGVIYVAHLDFLIGKERAGNSEGFAHLQELAGDIGVHGKL